MRADPLGAAGGSSPQSGQVAREIADLFTRGSARPRRPRRGASGSAMCLRVGCRSAVLACGVTSWARKRARWPPCPAATRWQGPWPGGGQGAAL